MTGGCGFIGSNFVRHLLAVDDPARAVKPADPKSDFAVVGVYVYPPDVFGLIRTLTPSRRGELEITDVNNHYIAQGRMGCFSLDGYWTDAGTLDSLDLANELVRKDPPRF